MSSYLSSPKPRLFSLLNIFLLSALIGFTGFSTDSDAAKRAPNFTVKDLNGKTYKLSNYRGKVVYLDFWASWCRPCLKSFSWMRKMQSRHSGKGLVILAVNLDKNKEDAWSFLRENKSNFKILHDPKGRVAEKYNVQVMPSSYLIDRKGRIRKIHHGFRESSSDKKERDILSLLK